MDSTDARILAVSTSRWAKYVGINTALDMQDMTFPECESWSRRLAYLVLVHKARKRLVGLPISHHSMRLKEELGAR